MKRITSKPEGDCTGIGKWMFWVIIGLVVAAWVAMAFKSKGQGVGVGALVGAKQPTIVPQLSPAAASVPAGGGGGDPCEGDTTPPIDTSDGWIIAPAVLGDLGPGQTVIGTSGGAGTSNSPITLAAALAYTSSVISGSATNKRRLYLRGGTYVGRYTVTMAGSASAPWIVQPHPGESVVLNQRSDTLSNPSTTTHVLVGVGTTVAKFIEFRGLEFTDRNYTPDAGDDEDSDYRAGIKLDRCSDITFQNCIIHDQVGSGLLTGSPGATNITARGCIFYNIGTAGNQKHHGVYIFNRAYPSGGRHIFDGNIFINITGWGIHLFSTGTGLPISGIYCTDNIVRYSGGNKGPVTMWDGHNASPLGEDVRLVNSVVSQVDGINFVKIDDIINGQIHNNYFQLGPGSLIFWSRYDDLIFKSNTVISTRISTGTNNAVNANFSSASWATLTPDADWNTYKLTDTTGFNVNGVERSFAAWQTATGDDANSTHTTTTTSGLTIKYIPNALDTNLVYFAIMNEASLSTVNIDLTPYWPAPCGTYEIRNAGSYEGALASSGAWTGQTAIPITMTGQNYIEAWHGDGPTWQQGPTFFAGVAKRIRAN